MVKPITWVIFTLLLTIVAVLGILGGCFSPMWVYLCDEGTIVAVGLMYRTEVKCDLDANDNCLVSPASFSKVKYNSPSTHDKVHWSAMTGLMIGGAAMGVILVVLFVIYAIMFTSKKPLHFLNFLLMIVTVLTWLPVGIGLIIFALYHGDAFTEGPHISTESFPWSALMCLIGSIFLVCVTILIRSQCRKEDYIVHAIPASADSKMELYPSTKSALLNRFFTPSVYREDHWQALSNVLNEENQNGGHQNGVTDNRPRSPLNARTHQQYQLHQQQQQRPQQQQQQLPQISLTQASSSEYQNQGYVRDPPSPYTVGERDKRRLTTEVILDRKGAAQNVDFDNEGSDVLIYKGNNVVEKISEVTPDVRNRRRLMITTPQDEERKPDTNDFVYQAQHMTDKNAHKVTQYMSHTHKPSEDEHTNTRLSLSPNNFTDTNNVKYSPTYVYRPFSEQVY